MDVFTSALQVSPELTGPYINNNYLLCLDWTYTVKKKRPGLLNWAWLTQLQSENRHS